ncbi:hypothetical protein CQ12_37250 [Bradyrhizobium jicamae]|uniref:Uncharacterized protein n=1 Tax=Bradyrhizobium jicamae TaxID=280332 RepID=A0A0R3LRA1_9BRAD|nr:hypothetical protein CQ12_37250 [Bradyrhizobium jicamae]
MIFVLGLIVIIKIEKMPCPFVPKQMSGKHPPFSERGVNLVGGLLSGWLESTDTVRCECRMV